jgi:hypothetical protein
MGIRTRREFVASAVGTAGYFTVGCAWAKDTSSHSERSKGGPHDYFSEGDYWWPDEKNPNAPYMRRDGFTNPANFDHHRKAMVRLSLLVPALAAAWELTGEKKYSDHAGKHLRAWFVDPSTKMNANLEYAQAIFNLNNGQSDYVALWKTLNPDPVVPEVIRNFPVRQPLLWMAKPGAGKKG